MVYLLYGGNSYQAIRKIKEFKNAFLKKVGRSDFIETIDGGDTKPDNYAELFFEGTLFSKSRLIIFKNIAEQNAELFKFMETKGEFLRPSRNVYLFWENKLGAPAMKFFKKYATKIQEVKPLSLRELDLWLQKKSATLGFSLSKEERETMIAEAGGGVEWALENELEKRALGLEAAPGTKPRGKTLGVFWDPTPSVEERGFKDGATSPFAFVERIFSAPLGRALLALKEAMLAGHEPQRFIYSLLWKAKQKKMVDAYWHGILAESAMRRDPKNAYEILERFILALKGS